MLGTDIQGVLSGITMHTLQLNGKKINKYTIIVIQIKMKWCPKNVNAAFPIAGHFVLLVRDLGKTKRSINRDFDICVDMRENSLNLQKQFSWLKSDVKHYSTSNCKDLKGLTSRCHKHINPLSAKLFNLNFHPLEVVSRWRDPQLQWVKIVQIWQNGGRLFSNIAE